MALTKVRNTGNAEAIQDGFSRVNAIIDDLASTSHGLGASCVGLEDALDNMSATNVEDALAEIYADTQGTRTLADALGENSSTITGLTWGWNAGTIRYDNSVVSVAAGTISLTDDATNYIECDTSGNVSRNTTGFTSGRIPMREVITLGGVQTTSNDKRAYLQVWTMPLPVTKGGTGVATLTDHGILLGSGTEAITPLGVATNGQIPIGSTGADPVLACVTGTTNQVTVTNGAGTITLSTPQSIHTAADVQFATATLNNTGLHLLDTNASHDLIIKPGSDLTEDRELTITTGDAARTITLAGDLTIAGAVSITAYGATILDDTDAATARATLEVDPVGSIIAWSTETPPTGYLECDGASLDRTTYAALFAVISTMYGTADGTHFNLPDYRGRFLRAWAHGSTNDPDRATRTAPGATGATLSAGDHVGTEQTEQLDQHNHAGLPTYQSATNLGSSSVGYWRVDSSSQTGTTANTGGNETRPINVNVMYCIKY